MSRLSVVLPAYNEELMVIKACRTLKAVLSLAGFILSLAVGTLVFGLSAVFSVVLLGIAGVWLVAKLLL